jgi:hypothetical protein
MSSGLCPSLAFLPETSAERLLFISLLFEGLHSFQIQSALQSMLQLSRCSSQTSSRGQHFVTVLGPPGAFGQNRTQTVPGFGELQIVSHSPSTQPSNPSSQTSQVTPLRPQNSSDGGSWQMLPAQQPPVQVLALHTAVQVPWMQSSLAAHGPQVAPPVPQRASVWFANGRQVPVRPPSQQPLGQLPAVH